MMLAVKTRHSTRGRSSLLVRISNSAQFRLKHSTEMKYKPYTDSRATRSRPATIINTPNNYQAMDKEIES